MSDSRLAELDELLREGCLVRQEAASRCLSSIRRVPYHKYHQIAGDGHGSCQSVTDGGSQAIRLPKEFRVESDTVHLKRTAEGFLVITKEPWDVFFEGVEQLSDKFFSSEREQPELETRG